MCFCILALDTRHAKRMVMYRILLPSVAFLAYHFGTFHSMHSHVIKNLHNYTNKLHSTYTHRIYLINRQEWYRWGMQRVWGRRETYTGFRWGNLTETDHLGKPGVDGRIILKWIFKKWDVGVWTGSSWFRIGTGGGQL